MTADEYANSIARAEEQADGSPSISRRRLLKGASLCASAALGGSVIPARALRAQDTSATGTSDAGGTGGTSDTGGAGENAALAATMRTASGGAVPGLDAPAAQRIAPAKVANDLAILNSALLLEYLEADFYSRVAQADAGRAYLPPAVRSAVGILQRDETTHVQAVSDMIRKLGATPLQNPGFEFPREVFVSSVAFLSLASLFEETGVSAYLGAAPQVKSKDVLKFAASIYGNETRHAGLIRYLQGELLAPHDMEMPITVEEAVARVLPYIIRDRFNPAAG